MDLVSAADLQVATSKNVITNLDSGNHKYHVYPIKEQGDFSESSATTEVRISRGIVFALLSHCSHQFLAFQVGFDFL